MGKIRHKTGDKKDDSAVEISHHCQCHKISDSRVEIVRVHIQEEFPGVDRVGMLTKPEHNFFGKIGEKKKIV